MFYVLANHTRSDDLLPPPYTYTLEPDATTNQLCLPDRAYSPCVFISVRIDPTSLTQSPDLIPVLPKMANTQAHYYPNSRTLCQYLSLSRLLCANKCTDDDRVATPRETDPEAWKLEQETAE